MEKTEREHALEKELMDQWFTNHAEHCGKLPPWPHKGECHWPVPSIVPRDRVYLLLLEVSGEAFGIR